MLTECKKCKGHVDHAPAGKTAVAGSNPVEYAFGGKTGVAPKDCGCSKTSNNGYSTQKAACTTCPAKK